MVRFNEKITPNTVSTNRIFYAKAEVDSRISVACVFKVCGGISFIRTQELISSVLPVSAHKKNL